MKAYSNQEIAIQNVLSSNNGLNKKDRTQLIMSCGTGKSLASMWIHEKYVLNLDSNLTILFYPSLFLVNQTYNTYKEHTVLNFNPLVVCSDKAIGDNENDDIFELDACEVKYPVTTNIEEIKTYLQDKSIKDKIVFITYQSSPLIGQALNELNMKADLGIFDEAHKTATVNIDSVFAYGLKDENIPIAKRLFMTATPRHIKFNIDEDDEVETLSMNNPELYGDIAYEYPMRAAINDGIITDYKIMGILIDDKYIDSYTNELKPYSEEIINEAKIKAINEAMSKYNLNKALIFNKDIAASKELERYSNSTIFNKTIRHLDGRTKHSYRESVLQELKDSKQFVITNAKLFTEGVDLPTIDMIALFRNVKSEIDIIQTVGRVQRVDKNNPNKVGYILLPIFVSNVDLIDEELKTNKDLGYVYDVISSLKENDEQLRATLEYKKQAKIKSKTNKNNDDESKIENPNFKIEYIVNNSNISEEHIKQVNEKITHKIESVILNEKWNYKTDAEWKKLFVEYIEEYGFEELNSTTTYKNEFIGVKITRLKTLYSNSSLQKQELMKRYWDCFPKNFFILREYKNDDEWKSLFIEYDNEIGIENIKQSTKYKKASLGNKLYKIRHIYNNSTLEKQKELIQFWDCFPHSLFEKREKTDEEWKKLFIEFIDKKGADSLTTTLVYQNENLGYKINTIRAIYNKSTPEKQKELKDYWDCIPKKMWEKIKKTDEEWRELFTNFIKEVGFCKLTFGIKYEDMNIGHKFQHIKNKYRKATVKKQKEMREFWDCFPSEIWGK